MKFLKHCSIIYLFVIMIGGCSQPRSIKITFSNNSSSFIDSAKIIIQNFELKLFEIQPHSKLIRKVSRDSIKLNRHDIMIRAVLYEKSHKKFKGGFYYNDLSGQLSDEYRIYLNDSLMIQIK